MVVRRLFRLLVVLSIMVFVSAAFAQDTPKLLTATIVAKDEGVELPKSLMGGVVTITFENDTKAPFSPIIARLNDGKTMDDFTKAMQNPGPTAVLETVTLIGGVEAAPKSAVDVTYELEAGNYVFINFAPNAPPDIKPFTVDKALEGQTLEAPEADVEVALVDFSVGIPAELKSGPQLWEIADNGEQFHELRVLKVDKDATIKDVTDGIMKAAAEAKAGPPELPYETAFFWTPMSPGMKAWVKVDLEPGTYAVLCALPDITSKPDAPPVSHLQHGMITLVTVSE